MPIDSNGWLDTALRWDGHSDKVNEGVNGLKGAVYHSAEGYSAYLLTAIRDINRRASWHFSNLKDGRLFQHYGVEKRTWTSGARFPNDTFVTVESEGLAGEVLTAAQIDNLTLVTKELSKLSGRSNVRRIRQWEVDAPDGVFLLVEHNECTRWGASATACPSGRIPWDWIIKALKPEEEDMAKIAELEAKIAALQESLSYHIARSLVIEALLRDFKPVPIAGGFPADETITIELRPLDGQPTMATLKLLNRDIERFGN